MNIYTNVGSNSCERGFKLMPLEPEVLEEYVGVPFKGYNYIYINIHIVRDN